MLGVRSTSTLSKADTDSQRTTSDETSHRDNRVNPFFFAPCSA